MNSTTPLARGSAVALALVLIALAVGFRLLRATMFPEMSNFAPLMALAVCGALFLPGALAFLVPLAALIGSDLLLNLHYGVALIGWAELVRYACYGLAVAGGLGLRRGQAGIPLTLGFVVASSLLFYVVTNTTSWFANPAYAPTAAGWVQALTVGLPGFPPTWTFFRTSLVSDLLFTGIFLAVMHFATRPQPAERASACA